MSALRAGSYRFLPTEQPNPNARHIDTRSTKSVVETINREDRKVAAAVGREAVHIAAAADQMAKSLKAGGRVFLVGAGTSGRLCVMEAAECPPTFGVSPETVQAIMAGGKGSVFRAKEGAEDDLRDGERQITRRAKAGDVIVGVAASGVTPFVRGALRAGRRTGCFTVLVTSNDRPVMPEARMILSPRTGPEIIAGSTRLKAGTAAKLVLNTLTTSAMIRLGKVYDRWMVDLKLTNRKLRLRATRIVCELGGVSPAMARSLLGKSAGNVKTAVLAARIREGSPAERVARAHRMLEAADGSLRAALDEL